MKVKRSADDFALTPIEKRYQEDLDTMTGMERMQRAQALCEGMWKILSHQIKLERGEVSTRELNYLVAQRIYVNDPKTLSQIEKMYYGH